MLSQSSSSPPASHLPAVNMPLFFYIIYILSLFISPTTFCFFPLLPQLRPASALTAVWFPTFFSVSLSMHVNVCDVSVTYQTNGAKSNLITQIYTIVCRFKGLQTVTAPICLSLDDHYRSSDCGVVPSIGLWGSPIHRTLPQEYLSTQFLDLDQIWERACASICIYHFSLTFLLKSTSVSVALFDGLH